MAAKGTQVTGVASPVSVSLTNLVSCSLNSTGSVDPSARPTATLGFVLFNWLIYHLQCPASEVWSSYLIDGLPLQPRWPPGVDLHMKTLNQPGGGGALL